MTDFADPFKNADPHTLKPEDIVEAGVAYLVSRHGDESNRLEYLESVYEGLRQLLGLDMRAYFSPDIAPWVAEHYGEILQAAQYLIQIERDKLAGRIQ